MYNLVKAGRLRHHKEPVGRDDEGHNLQRPTSKLKAYAIV
jgi:hypothetical protein